MNFLSPVRAALRWLTLITLAAALAPAVAQADTPAPGHSFKDCSDCPDMVALPAGQFQMGTSSTEQTAWGVAPHYASMEGPLHPVTIARPFAIGKFQITRDQWAAYVEAQGHGADPASGCAVLTPDTGAWGVDPQRSWRDPGFVQDGNHPVVCINFTEAQHYAAWLSKRTGKHYRLPSEAEWEYAARAGTSTANYWGNDRDDACAHTNATDLNRAEQHRYVRAAVPDGAFLCHDGYVFTAPVDAKPANPWGLYGMSGNVWQMTADCLNENYDSAPADGSARTTGDCRSHIDRGASWVNSPKFVRAGQRHPDLLDARNSVLGLRLVRELN